jgi:hypothetical protein
LNNATGQKIQEKTRENKKIGQIKVILVQAGDMSSEEDRDEEFDEGRMYLDKESIQLIFNALREYKPTEDEEHLHGILLEEFEEILVVDYNEPYPDVN